MVALALGQILDRTILESEVVEPVKRLRGQQEQLTVAFHAPDRNQVPHDGIANARLAVVRTHRDARDLGHPVFELVQGAATVNAVVDAVHHVVLELFGNTLLGPGHQVTLRDVVLHNPQNIGNVFHVGRPDTRILVGVHHGTITPGTKYFLQHTALELAA